MEVRLGTGRTTGVYYKVDALKISEQLQGTQLHLTPYPTSGTPEIISKIKSGELDAGIVQFNGLLGQDPNAIKMIAKLHDEFVFILALKNGGIKSVKDLDKKTTLAIGTGGSALTWSDFVNLDDGYKGIPTVPTSGALALADLNTKKIAAVMMVGGLKLGDMLRANQSKDYRLVKVDDANFNNLKFDGERVYEFDDVDDDVFPNLISWGSVETLKTKAVMVVSVKWIEQNGEEHFGQLFDAVNRAVPNIAKELVND